MAEELVLVTGASSDIGLAIVHDVLGHSAARVLAHYFRSADRFAPLQSAFGDRITLLQADLSVAAETERLQQEIAAIGTPSSVVHLPASRLTYGRFTKLNWAKLEEEMTLQVGSIVTLLQAFLPRMVKMPRARVVFVLSSVVHGMPPKFMAPYTIVKHAQLGLMRALAAEYAGTPLRVNAVSPGMVETRFLSEIGDVAVQMAAAGNPSGRNARPEDIVGALRFLLSAESDYMTGVDIPIAGGAAV